MMRMRWAELGFDIQRLDAPLIWREPATSPAPEAFVYDPGVGQDDGAGAAERGLQFVTRS